MRKTYIKYLIQKFRQKISYIAFTKKMTIVELFCTAIKKTHTQLLKEGLIKIDQEKTDNDNFLYEQLMSGNETLFKSIISLNMDKIKGSDLHAQVVCQLEKSKMEDEKKVPYTFKVIKNGVSKEITIDLQKN